MSGLNETERERLSEAGFDAGVTAAVAEEAASMRFLWLRRSGFNAITGVAGAAGAAAVANIFAEDFGPLGVWLPVLLPIAAAALGLAPWWEIRTVKDQSRTRWAARKLAALAVTADPEDETDEDWGRLQSLAAAVADAPSTHEALDRAADALDAEDDALETLLASPGAAAASGDTSGAETSGGETGSGAAGSSRPSRTDTAASPGRGAGPQRRNPAPSRMTPAPARSMTPDQRDRLYDAIRTGVIIAALIALTILLLIRRQIGA